MRISLIQTDIAWAEPEVNLQKYLGLLSALQGKSDLAVLPEMCLSGFGAPASEISETNQGKYISRLRKAAADYELAVTGSFSAFDEKTERYFNRAFFFTPDGLSYYYDKKHLFSIGDETKAYSAGNKLLTFKYLNWNIRLIVCYDLRFPLWCRNRQNEYDLLLVVANWPQARQKAWTTLLQARALENLAYVCGVNRLGEDGLGVVYRGDSVLLDYKANALSTLKAGLEQTETVSLDLEALRDFRQKFPAWKDADAFQFSEE
ncbi:MAG: nitrilase family protein [Bacteroidales bacterium]|nr:nitrilase family protein [Bacteroidales bacterium]MDD3431687.1 nitrilase family protein [Bacteroidales bacterium]MDD4361484.1 nitrilase family protein [Bacteroidales bacterium]MDD4430495.1 nitrilase family protein [Bacteroidales bacterium]